MLETDEVVRYKLGDDGRMMKVVKHRKRVKVRLSKAQMQEIEDTFNLFDKDESGQMDI